MLNYKQWWFVYSYLLLVLISPILELSIKQMDMKMMTKVIFLLSIVTFYFSWFKGYDTKNGYNVYFFCYLYLLARYIRIAKDKRWFLMLKKYSIMLFLAAVMLQMLLFLIVMKQPCKENHAYKVWGYNNPLIVIAALEFFVLFSNLHFKTRMVNILSVGTFGIYLLHAGPAFARIWEWIYIKGIRQSRNYRYFWLSILRLCEYFDNIFTC